MGKTSKYRDRSYSNSRLKPKQLTAKQEHELRTFPYHNGGGINHRTPFSGKDKIWWETQRDQLFQHIDWQREAIAKGLESLLEYDSPTPEQEATERRRESMTPNEIIREVAASLSITL